MLPASSENYWGGPSDMAVLQFFLFFFLNFSFYFMWIMFGLHVCLHICVFGTQCQQRPEEELDLERDESLSLMWMLEM